MSQAPVIEVAIADKSSLIQRGLKALLEEDGRFEVVVSASDGERFLDACRRFRFDIGVIGWVMPFLDGRGVLQALHDRPGAPRIVVYTGSSADDVPREVMRLGGAGFCSKSEPPERLLDVLAAVARGHMVFPFIDLRAAPDDPLRALTPRERELLEALGTGRTNAELAKRFGVSANTVKFHLRNLFDKLGVRSRAQAVGLFHAKAGPTYPKG
ncbi:LuxR C-terminal-related transcriptional regulator [Marinivivus vitaminiproducens]|uniref:LuxR C-terminal-related transcriptional regulator n=1 Tax=Marinivivus vitaminiproducens TaxID=3035935 RepID=UPI0027A21E22|nr:response regulator transcription factor [Geminicoccaceae bacterium SCSIO 64248]